MAVTDVNYYSNTLNRYVEFKMILPIEYTGASSLEKKEKPQLFKTLYLLHGFSGNKNDWMYHSRIFKLARDHNLAVVMPSGENSFYLDKPNGSKYGSYIGKEIVDITRAMFPLSTNREDTFIGGLSMGGFGSLLLGCQFSDTFSKIVSLSGGFVLEEIVEYKKDFVKAIGNQELFTSIFGNLSTLLDTNSPQNPLFFVKRAISANKMPLVYMACGTSDYVFEGNVRMKNNLESLNVPLTWIEDSGDHSWQFWDLYIEKAILWLLYEQ